VEFHSWNFSWSCVWVLTPRSTCYRRVFNLSGTVAKDIRLLQKQRSFPWRLNDGGNGSLPR
jgi:hypothetical protein